MYHVKFFIFYTLVIQDKYLKGINQTRANRKTSIQQSQKQIVKLQSLNMYNLLYI